jgi:hypothetical protein
MIIILNPAILTRLFEKIGGIYIENRKLSKGVLPEIIKLSF